MNLYISELEVREGEESVYAQKDYNHLYWYMITIIIFYGIPAFQLVITYQQVGGYHWDAIIFLPKFSMKIIVLLELRRIFRGSTLHFCVHSIPIYSIILYVLRPLPKIRDSFIDQLSLCCYYVIVTSSLHSLIDSCWTSVVTRTCVTTIPCAVIRGVSPAPSLSQLSTASSAILATSSWAFSSYL